MKFEYIGNCILFKYKPNKSKIDGFFDRTDGHIYIQKSLDKYTKEITYQHEKQHKKCFKTKCFCWTQESDFWGEYHAFKAELIYALNGEKIVQIKYLQGVIDDLKKFRELGETNKSSKEHYVALKRICKLKIFKLLAQARGFWSELKEL
jgi:hypothetical protein